MLQTELGEVGWANVWKTQGGAVRSFTNIYSLLTTIRKTGKSFSKLATLLKIGKPFSKQLATLLESGNPTHSHSAFMTNAESIVPTPSAAQQYFFFNMLKKLLFPELLIKREFLLNINLALLYIKYNAIQICKKLSKSALSPYIPQDSYLCLSIQGKM